VHISETSNFVRNKGLHSVCGLPCHQGCFPSFDVGNDRVLWNSTGWGWQSQHLHKANTNTELLWYLCTETAVRSVVLKV